MADENIMDYIKKSFEFKRQGFYKQAIEMLYKALVLDNDNVEILAQLAELYYLLENFERAEHYATKTLELDASNLLALNLCKDVSVQRKDFRKAEDIANRIYEIAPLPENICEIIKIASELNDFEKIKSFEHCSQDLTDTVLYEIAKAYYKNFDFDTTTKYLERAKSLNPDNTDVALLLAKIYYSKKEFDRAREIFYELEHKTENDDVWNFIGLFKLDELKLEDAIKYFLRAYDLNPKNPQYAYNLAHAYFLSGLSDEAIVYFNKAICQSPDNLDYHYSLAYLYFHEKLYDKSLFELKFIKSKDENYIEATVLYALINSIKGDYIGACRDLEYVIEIDPNNDFAMYSLARTYLNLEMYEKTEIMLEKAVALKGDYLEYLNDYGEILIHNKKFEKVQEIIDKMFAYSPHYIPAYVLLLKLFSSLSLWDKVINWANKLLALDLNNSSAHYYSACAKFQLKNYNQAIDDMKKAILANVHNASMYAKLSEFYEEIGEIENALAYISEACDISNNSAYREKYMKLASINRRAKRTS